MAEARFAGQVVMITGAASGFGAAAARRFASEGAKLVLCDRNGEALHRVTSDFHKSNIIIVSKRIDITNESQLEKLMEDAQAELGPLDVAINNAGIGQALQPLTETSTTEFDRVMAVNARGVFLGMKHQLPGMIARRRGVILNMASAAGLVGAGQMAAYAASKHAVVGLTRAAADEVSKYGIRINALCPSFAPTPLFNEIADEVGERHGLDREAAYARIAARIPMRRVAEIGEVVQAMLWACDPENSFMTGQAIAIDGGLTAV